MHFLVNLTMQPDRIPSPGIQRNLLMGFDLPIKLVSDTNLLKLAISSRDRSYEGTIRGDTFLFDSFSRVY